MFLSLSHATTQLWAKTKARQEPQWHPLWCHVLDVMHVAQAIAAVHLPVAAQKVVAAAFGVSHEEVPSWVALFAGMHDIGKASLAFQLLWPPAKAQLQNAGFGIPDNASTQMHHGLISVLILHLWLQESWKLDSNSALALARAVGGHHGHMPTNAAVVRKRGRLAHQRCIGADKTWQQARQEILALLQQHAGTTAPLQIQLAYLPQALPVLAGLTSVADWLGSDARLFGFAPEACSATYPALSRERAQKQLQRTG